MSLFSEKKLLFDVNYKKVCSSLLPPYLGQLACVRSMISEPGAGHQADVISRSRIVNIESSSQTFSEKLIKNDKK